ncbi:ABC transporter G family member 11-like [Populus alba x Populus x berolinensis]|nr:ABC transporter G family member 11-like [Populus alba x Populus x berolinensis]
MHNPFSDSMIKLPADGKTCMASSSPSSNYETDHSALSPNEEPMEAVDLENGPAFGSCRDVHRKDVSITWENLGVTVSDRKHGCRSILQGLTGYARPGEVLAIMGPSGCGKTTLLDALAVLFPGRLDSSTKHSGEVLINGRKQPLAYGTSAYVTQDDVITWTLTVREAVFYSAQLQLPNSMSLSKKKERAETTIKEMGLQDSMDTRIGGWSNKGLSSGQKRRVSICLEILTRPKLLFLDEPSLSALSQPMPSFFESNGFPCPSHQNPSDHYLHTINTDFDEDMDQGFHAKKTTEEAIDFLVRSYKSSHTCQQIQRHVAEICSLDREELKKGSQANFISQCLILTRRSFVNMYRDLGYYWLRLAIYIALCSGLGSVFYDIGSGYSSIQARGSLLMFTASFLTIMAIGGFPSFVEDMKVFQRERLNGHYRSAAFVVSNTVSSTPFLLVISLIPGAITYYLVGLQQGCAQFIYFALTLLACMMLVESLMLIVASIMPNFLMGLITGAGIQGLMILSGGFFRLPRDLPLVFWRYPLYYIAFHRYAYQGLFKNEFEGLAFPNGQVLQGGGPAYIEGEEILRIIWQVEMRYSKWMDLAMLFAMAAFYRIMLLIVLGTVEKFKPIIREIKFVFLSKTKKYGS